MQAQLYLQTNDFRKVVWDNPENQDAEDLLVYILCQQDLLGNIQMSYAFQRLFKSFTVAQNIVGRGIKLSLHTHSCITGVRQGPGEVCF